MLSSRFFLLSFSFCFCLFARAQKTTESCPDLKNGLFFSYPSNSTDRWKCERRDGVQTEINLTNNDTVVYNVSWQNNCQYTLKYATGGKGWKRDMLTFLKQHSIVYTITASTPGYYVTTSYIDAATNYPVSIDTMWNKEQNAAADRVVYIALSAADVRKAKLKDISQFALLYVYRPSKFICSAVQFPMYGNDMLMCGFPEKGGAFVFKVVKRGPLRLQGQHRQTKDYLDVNIDFGQKYYVQVDTKWSMSRCIPFLTEKDKKKGEEEFLEAQY